MGPTCRSVFHYTGVGVSVASADTATGIAFALTKNRLTADFGAVERVDEIVTKGVAES